MEKVEKKVEKVEEKVEKVDEKTEEKEEVGDNLADVGEEEGIEEREMLGVFYENDFEVEEQENDSATDENNETKK